MASIMGAPPLLRSLLLGLCMVLLTFNFSIATQQTERIVAVVGNGECLDCAQKSIEKEEAFKGLHVAIQCKTGNGFHETKGVGLLDKSGSFEVQLPSDVLRDDGELKDECFAQLRSASEAPCPDNNGLDQSKVVLKSKESGKHTFVVAAGKLPFSSTCTSAFHSKFHPFHKHLLKFKHKFDFHHHDFPHKPIIKKKFPPIPIYKKPIPPLLPVHKLPIIKKKFPPIPIYKKPIPPLPPVHKLPIIKKKFPPIPIHKKPLPPIPKPPLLYHPHPKFPPIDKKPLHPFYHPHPKFLFPPKPKFFKKKHPIFPPVKEHPIP
ncbi:proline-rich protein 4-like [Phoenix dactylifera]|uniref:Proline-rich protein 4-like n=1 Tax=Phoenix dactylifera TaxID=42345 RepID=A0A8B7BZ32_PHODC|nr:proline-rich protein 4-like [Phoenix dactylifera]